MYLHFNLRYAKALAVADAGKRAEYYHTYQVYSEDPSNESSLLTQGFSLGCPVGTGYSFKAGEQRELNDPRFTVALPPLAEGAERRLVIDIHCWESDHSTEEVKKVFTNKAAEKLLAIYASQKFNKKKTQEEFTTWLQDEGIQTLIDMVATGVPPVAAALVISKQLVPFIKWAVELVKSNSDDYVGLSRTELFYTLKDGKYRYRWLVNNGVETWIDQESAPYYAQLSFTSANGKNQLAVQTIFQPIYDAKT